MENRSSSAPTSLNSLLPSLDARYISLTPSTDTRNVIQPSAATVKGLVIKGFTSQSDSLQEWQNSSATALSLINKDGHLYLSSTVATSSTDDQIYINSALTNGGGVTMRSSGATSGRIGTLGNAIPDWYGYFANMKYNEGAGNWNLDAPTLYGSFYKIDVRGGVSPFTDEIAFYSLAPGSNPRADSALRSLFKTKMATGKTLIGLVDPITNPTAQLDILPSSSTTVGLIVKGAASQSANLTEWQNSSAGVVHATGDGLAGSEWVINEGGIDIDFRVESDNYNALFIDASNDAAHLMNNTSGKISFFGVTAVTRQTELTDELTTITHTAPGTPDYAIQDLTLTGFGFVTADEGNTVLSVIANLQARVNEIETKLTAYGLLQDAD